MTNWRPERVEEYRDVQTLWNYHHSALKKSPQKRLERLWRSSRDNARTPVQWSGAENAGFTTGKPLISVNPNYPEINVAQQEEDPDSVLNFYRKAIALRKDLACVRHGSYREYFRHSGKHYVYARQDGNQKLLVVCSFSPEVSRLKLPKGFEAESAQLLLCNYPAPRGTTLQPYECRVYLWE